MKIRLDPRFETRRCLQLRRFGAVRNRPYRGDSPAFTIARYRVSD